MFHYLGVGVGSGLYFGLRELGVNLRAGLVEQADVLRHVGTGVKQHGSATARKLKTTRGEWSFWFGDNEVGGLCVLFVSLPYYFSNLCVLFVCSPQFTKTSGKINNMDGEGLKATTGVNCSNTEKDPKEKDLKD